MEKSSQNTKFWPGSPKKHFENTCRAAEALSGILHEALLSMAGLQAQSLMPVIPQSEVLAKTVNGEIVL